jgi:hypothetical protein
MSNITYDVYTDIDPQSLSEIGLAVYEMWVSFAMGRETLGGFRIESPTGKYAASISYRKTGVSKITIAQDETAAPEGRWLEEGHAAIDMTQIPSYRGRVLSRTQMTANRGRRKSIWATAQGGSDFVQVPLSRASIDPGRLNTSGTDAAWVIPAMPAYSPAAHLADLARNVAQSGWRR